MLDGKTWYIHQELLSQFRYVSANMRWPIHSLALVLSAVIEEQVTRPPEGLMEEINFP